MTAHRKFSYDWESTAPVIDLTDDANAVDDTSLKSGAPDILIDLSGDADTPDVPSIARKRQRQADDVDTASHLSGKRRCPIGHEIQHRSCSVCAEVIEQAYRKASDFGGEVLSHSYVAGGQLLCSCR